MWCLVIWDQVMVARLMLLLLLERYTFVLRCRLLLFAHPDNKM